MQIVLDEKFKSALEKLAKSSMPIKAAISLARNIKVINDGIDKYQNVRISLIKELGSKDEEGKYITNPDGTVKFSNENLTQFTMRLTEILSDSVEVDAVNAESLGDMVMTPEEASLILPLIK